MTEYEARQISVSRDALRADLAEMELRLRTYFDGRIASKAETAELESLTKRVDLHENGVFPPAWELRLNTMIISAMNAEVNNTWSGRHRRIEVFSVLLSLLSVAGTVILGIRFH